MDKGEEKRCSEKEILQWKRENQTLKIVYQKAKYQENPEKQLEKKIPEIKIIYLFSNRFLFELWK